MLDRLLGAPFALASRLRGARVFHPRGVVIGATWEPAEGILPGSPLTRGPHRALLRVSHAIGLPAGVPDIVWLAVRVIDVHGPGEHQDLLLASSGRGPVGRHLLRPVSTVTGTVLSSLLPYEVDGVGRHPLLARTVDENRPVTYPEVERDPAATLPDIEIVVDAEVPRRLGILRIEDEVPVEGRGILRFDPWHTGPGLRPAGLVNRLRRPTYEASQVGRGAA